MFGRHFLKNKPIASRKTTGGCWFLFFLSHINFYWKQTSCSKVTLRARCPVGEVGVQVGTKSGPSQGGRLSGLLAGSQALRAGVCRPRVQNTKINSVVQRSLAQSIHLGRAVAIPTRPRAVCPVQPQCGQQSLWDEWPSIGWNQRARWAALGLELCQGLASSWGGPRAPQVGKSRHWLTLDEAGPLLLFLTYRSPGLWAEGGSTQQP